MGFDDADARRAALERFGNVQRVADAMRHLAADRERSAEMSELLNRVGQGTRQALRRLRRDWRYSSAVIGILAVGIGPAAAMISVIYNVLLRPLDYREPERLGMLRVNLAQLRNHPGLSPAEALALQRAGVFDDIAIESRLAEASLGPPGDLVPLSMLGFSVDMLPMLGVHPYLGRSFAASDFPPPPTGQGAGFTIATRRIMLDYTTWQTRFSGSRDALGKLVLIDGAPAEVIGVLPPGFELATGRAAPRRVDIYAAFALRESWSAWMFPTIARLKPGQTFAQAQARIDVVAAAIKRDHPDVYQGELRLTIAPLLEDMTESTRPSLRAAGAAVILLFIVAFANATALVLARMRSREVSFAVRHALGATRRALILHAFGENLLLAVSGAAAGSLMALVTIAGIRHLIPHTVPRWEAIGLGWDQVLWAAALAAVGLLLIGVVPLIRLARGAAFFTLRIGAGQTGTGDAAKARLVLVGAQIVLTVVLAFGSVQLARSAAQLRRVDLGFDPDVLTARVEYDRTKYPTGSARAEIYRRIRDAARRVPGVLDAGISTHVPLSGSTMMDGYQVDLTREPTLGQSANYQGVTPGYFSTLRIPMLQGRDFTDEEDADTLPVIIVDEMLVRTVFPHEKRVIGKTLRLGWGLPNARIVGVVGNARVVDPGRVVRPVIYAPIGNLFQQAGIVVVRTSGDARALAVPIADAIRLAGPGRAVSNVAMLTENLASATSTLVAVTWLLMGLALSAGLLSAVGLYLVISFVVHERRRATAIRIALGATPGRVMWDNFESSGIALAIALPLGALAALAASPYLDELVYGVPSRDPWSLATAILIAMGAGLLGTYTPLRRAARLNILTTLREA